jgi:hypothetical protein
MQNDHRLIRIIIILKRLTGHWKWNKKAGIHTLVIKSKSYYESKNPSAEGKSQVVIIFRVYRFYFSAVRTEEDVGRPSVLMTGATVVVP